MDRFFKVTQGKVEETVAITNHGKFDVLVRYLIILEKYCQFDVNERSSNLNP
jgi:hypothetical protein